jgi:hypothetical protein
MFGWTVDIDGDTAVVGAARDDLNGNDAGAVYVYVKAGNSWDLHAEVTAPDGVPGDEFGYRVAIDGDTLVVGAWLDDTVAGLRSGSAYVFVRSGEIWTFQAKLRPSDHEPNDRFGLAVAVDGDTIAVASGNDLNDAPLNYLFRGSGATWIEEARLLAGGSPRALAVSGDRFVVGRDGWYARVYARSGGTWPLEEEIAPGFHDPGYGRWVAIEDDTVVVVDAGEGAFVYELSGGAWLETAEIEDPPGEFTRAAAISNGRVLVSSSGSGGAKPARLYERDATGWTEAAQLLGSNPPQDYGHAIFLSRNTAVIGTRLSSGLPGQAYAFALDEEFSPLCDASDGALALCPCANPGSPDTGCDIQQGTGGVLLDITGRTFGPQNQATAVGTGYPPTFTPSATLVRSANLHPSGTVVFGDGVFCLANPVVRLGGAIAINGQTTHVFGHGAMAGSGTFFYQLHYRNTPAMFCTPEAFNLSSGRAITW